MTTMLAARKAITAYRQGDTSVLQELDWLRYIASAEERNVNLERIESLQELALANPVLDYVERSLAVLEKLSPSFWIKELLEEVLIWAETAKGGTLRERLRWQQEGINCHVHNIGSAQLYARHIGVELTGKDEVIHTLICTHGLVGQYLRGEVPYAEHRPLSMLVARGQLTSSELEALLIPLNECVIGAVSQELWQSIQPEVEAVIRSIAYGSGEGAFTIKDRLSRLRTAVEAAGVCRARASAAAASGGADAVVCGAGDAAFFLGGAAEDACAGTGEGEAGRSCAAFELRAADARHVLRL
jgi:hypothetical protein